MGWWMCSVPTQHWPSFSHFLSSSLFSDLFLTIFLNILMFLVQNVSLEMFTVHGIRYLFLVNQFFPILKTFPAYGTWCFSPDIFPDVVDFQIFVFYLFFFILCLMIVVRRRCRCRLSFLIVFFFFNLFAWWWEWQSLAWLFSWFPLFLIFLGHSKVISIFQNHVDSCGSDFCWYFSRC
jgi:hypothetical protein